MPRVSFPASLRDAVTQASEGPGVELKAGGTDVVDRLTKGGTKPDTVVDLRRLVDTRITEGLDAVSIGAGATLATIAASPELKRRYPVLAEAALETATPQIRARATLGGALCQRPRCVYFRHPDYTCAKEGGAMCFARYGENRWHAVFDNDGCVAVHPSTVGAALLALDARLLVHAPGGGTRRLGMDEFFAVDPRDPTVENALEPGAVVERVFVPRIVGRVAQSYRRLASRAQAEWADVEVAACLVLDGGSVRSARVVLGAVGRVPRRATATERALVGSRLDAVTVKKAAELAAEGAQPLAHNQPKVDAIRATVWATLEELA